MKTLKEIEDEYGLKVNNESWGACFECCDFEEMVERTQQFYRQAIKEILEDVVTKDEEEPTNVEHPYYQQYCDETIMRNGVRAEIRANAVKVLE